MASHRLGVANDSKWANMSVFQCEGLYIGLICAYHTPPEEPHIQFLRNDLVFLCSGGVVDKT